MCARERNAEIALQSGIKSPKHAFPISMHVIGSIGKAVIFDNKMHEMDEFDGSKEMLMFMMIKFMQLHR